MFVKKFVEKASKKPGGNLDSIKSEDVDPCLVFHYGIPSGSILLAYDSVQQILAISTKDGRIKLYGRDYSQALLESTEAVPSKFLKFFENEGILLNVNADNQIEVWDINMKVLLHIHVFKGEITSLTVIQHSLFMYVGDSAGNISVLKLDKEPFNIVQMKYCIPFSASHGNTAGVVGDSSVMFILPQPKAESKRVLIIYRDGFITLWAIQESNSVFTSGGPMLTSVSHETKKVTAACWACPFGSKVAVGYSNGEIFIWSVPPASASKLDKDLYASQSAPINKLNIGYKLDKIPIGSLKWAYADGKASRLYITGLSDVTSANLLQVVLLNEQTESRMTKLGLHSSEPCVDMEIISISNEQSKHKQDAFLLLGKSGHIYAYDDSAIEKYLLQFQSRSPPSLPKELLVKMPLADSSVYIAKFTTENQYLLSSEDEGSSLLEKLAPSLFSFDMKLKDATQSTQFSGFSKSKNLYITGHHNGAINFWDASCPIMLPIASIVQQSEVDSTLSGVALTALHFDYNSRLLISGDQSGMIRIIGLKSESFIPVNNFISLPGNFKKGSNHIVHSLKLVKVNGAVLSIVLDSSSRRLAVGSDQGYVSVIDMEGPTLLYEKHIASELCTGVVSLQFETCSYHGFEKNVIVMATKDSSVLAIESDTGNTLGSGLVGPQKPSRALFMQVLDKESVLICSEKATYVYSLPNVVQGIKQVLHKKKFNSSSCCWASTFHTPDAAGLILVFSNGRIQIRSLPDLSLLKETSIRGLTLSAPKLNSAAAYAVCSSVDGELVMVNGDQEMFFVSVLLQKKIYRHLDSISRVYKKDLIATQGVTYPPAVHKEKKKGLFGSVIKEKTGSKSIYTPEEEAESARESIEELSAIFSVDNFPSFAESRANLAMDEDEVELNIDDIDLEDSRGKSKGSPIMAALNKKKFTSKFQALNKQISVKLKEMKGNNEKLSPKEVPTKEEPLDEKAGSIDQIKKKYGFNTSGDSSAAKMAQSKLSENSRKLQGISTRTTEMQNTAQSFSSLAKEVRRLTEHGK